MAAEGVVFLQDLGILAVSALLLSLLFARLKVSVVSAQILAGMIVGPYVLNLVTNTTVLNELSSAGIVLLLFIIGLELDPVELRKLAGEVAAFMVMETAIAFLFGIFGAFVLNLTLLPTLIFAMAGSITSTAIVGKVFLERRMLQTRESKFLIGLLVFEDIAAVVFLIVLSSISAAPGSLPLSSTGLSSTATGVLGAMEAVAGGLLLLILGYLVARHIAPPVINYLSSYEEEFEEIPFLFALGLGFFFAVLAAYLGYSPGIGAFIIGLSIRGKHSRFLSRKIAPVKDLFIVLFFVSMGSLIDPIPAFSLGFVVVVALGLLILGKFIGGLVIGKWLARSKNGERTEDGSQSAPPIRFTSWLIPRGEFSLIIAQLGLSLSLIDLGLFSIIGIAVLVTAVLGSILQKLTEPRKAPSDFPIKPYVDD